MKIGPAQIVPVLVLGSTLVAPAAIRQETNVAPPVQLTAEQDHRRLTPQATPLGDSPSLHQGAADDERRAAKGIAAASAADDTLTRLAVLRR